MNANTKTLFNKANSNSITLYFTLYYTKKVAKKQKIQPEGWIFNLVGLNLFLFLPTLVILIAIDAQKTSNLVGGINTVLLKLFKIRNIASFNKGST